MHAYYIGLLFELLAKSGIAEQQIKLHAGLRDFRLDNTLELTSKELNALFQSALDLSGDQQLGLKFGNQINVVPQGILGYAITTSATVGEALKLLVRYHRSLLPSLSIELKPEDGNQALIAKGNGLHPALERFYVEVLYAGVITAGSILMSDHSDKTSKPRENGLALVLDYNAPYDESMYRAIFGEFVLFNSHQRALYFHNKNLDVPISTSNSAAQDIFRRECERLLPHDNSDESLSEQIERFLVESRTEFPSIKEVAKKLNLSESTLRRKLTKEASSYQQILDTVRHRMANEYLKSTQLTVSEIAYLLGFSDSANFRKAYRRWANTTPSSARV